MYSVDGWGASTPTQMTPRMLVVIQGSVSLPGLPCGSVLKNPPANPGGTVSIPGSARSPGKGNSHPFPLLA